MTKKKTIPSIISLPTQRITAIVIEFAIMINDDADVESDAVRCEHKTGTRTPSSD